MLIIYSEFSSSFEVKLLLRNHRIGWKEEDLLSNESKKQLKVKSVAARREL
jgi:hypothetical protein